MKLNKELILQSLETCKKSNSVKISSNIIKALVRWFILLSIGYIVLYPLFYMITTSISTKEVFLDPTSVWIPTAVTFENFTFMYKVMDYGSALLSTLKIEMVSAMIEVFTCAIVGYGFARFKFPFKKVITTLLFVTILIPTPMIIIPLMTNFSKLDLLGVLGLINKIFNVDLRPDILGTPWTFYLPSLFASGLKSGLLIYIYIQFFKGLPHELEEAAWIDGAGPIRTFFAIAVPSSTVVILTVTVFSVIWHWNDYFMASMLMDDGYPLAVTMSKLHDLLNYNGIYLSPEKPNGLAYVMTGCLMFIVPPLIFYSIVQRWFVESIDRVGITG